jgi:hypothetical protein
MFKSGNMVELIGPREMLKKPLRVGMRGTVICALRGRCSRSPDCRCGDTTALWWECRFHGIAVRAREGAIRAVPPDEGRQAVRWDECDWRPNGWANMRGIR